MVLAAGFLVTRYGNERMDSFTAKEIAGLRYLYQIAPPGALLVAASPNVPWLFQDGELYHYRTMSRLQPMPPRDALTPAHVKAVVGTMSVLGPRPSYLVVTRSQKAALELFSHVSTSSVDAWERALVTSGRLRLIYDNGDAQIFILAHPVLTHGVPAHGALAHPIRGGRR
jgi:hypothetical protein